MAVVILNFSPVHDAQHLFADILSTSERSCLDEVFVAPGVGKLIVLPRVIDSQQSQVVSLRLVKLGFLLVCQSLFVLR